MIGITELLIALRSLPFPVAHVTFLKPQTPPYLIYLDDSFKITSANSKKTNKTVTIQLELYTNLLGTTVDENTLESILDSFTTYEKSRTYITSEGINVTYYTFNMNL